MAKRDKAARGIEIGAGTTAATVGTALGAAKLRDAYIEDYKPHFERQARHAQSVGDRVAPRVGRLTRIATHGKPGFIPLAVGAAAAGGTAGARKYRMHRERALAKNLKDTRRRAEGKLRSVATFDDSVRGFRRMVVPASPDVIQAVSTSGRKARAKVDQEFGKSSRAHQRGALRAVGEITGQ